ncbi:hypothetical protein ACFLR1_04700, partial [Bacteroidota bacterium]
LGLDDYILKDRLVRLGGSVQKAIDKQRLKTEKQDALTALKLSEKKYSTLADVSPAGIFRVDAGGHCSYRKRRLRTWMDAGCASARCRTGCNRMERLGFRQYR